MPMTMGDTVLDKVDAKASKEHLDEIAQRLEVDGRSTMGKDELVDEITKANRAQTAESRES